MKHKAKLSTKNTPSQPFSTDARIGKAGRAVLSQLVNFLNTEQSGDAQKLWNILTALRGPDAHTLVGWRDGARSAGAVKLATTAVIRHALGLNGKVSMFLSPVLEEQCNYKYATKPDSDKNVKIRTGVVREHFSDHAYDAFRALGLKWGAKNK